MALRDLLGYIDDKLQSVYETVARDPAKDRDKMVKGIEATKTKFLATEPARGKKDYSVNNNVVRYSPTFSGNAVTIHDRSTLHIPAERFAEFLDKLKGEVSSGALDKELEAAASGEPTTAPSAKPARKPRTSSGERGGWSPERRAAFDASIAARRKAKEDTNK